MQELMDLFSMLTPWLEEAIVLRHHWNSGDLLVFDNHTFLHRREGLCVDPTRELVRIWVSRIPQGDRQPAPRDEPLVRT